MSMSSETRYRILFYLVAAFGFVAAYFALKKPRPGLDLMGLAEKRDVQFDFTVEPYGYKYKGHTGNVIDEQVLLCGLYEKAHLFFMRDYLHNVANKDAIVVDVGANTGNHSLFLSRSAAKVISFEPFPPVIAKFRENLAINPEITNIDLREIALGDHDGELPFVAPPSDNHGAGTFRTSVAKEEKRDIFAQKLRVVVGDEALKDDTGPIVLIKIDVEGFEEGVLKGLQQTLARARPLVDVEVSLPPLGTMSTIDQVEKLFPSGYRFMAFDARSVEGSMAGKYKVHPLTAKDFKSEQTDVIAYPPEREAAVPH